MRGARPVRGSRLRILPGVLVVALLLLLPIGVGASSARAGPRTGQSGLGLTVTPSTGLAPLFVRFSVTTPNSTTPNLQWTFGDGAYLNGSFQDAHAPAHVYELAGTYTVGVAALYGGGEVTASAPIVVVASNLSASLSVSPPNGTVPLTVWLNGTPDGGSGTYVECLWEFGDGHRGSGLSVEYTYNSAGTFVANFTVTDTFNETAVASATIVAAPPPGPPDDAGAGSRNSGNGSVGGVGLTPPVAVGTAAAGAVVLVAIGAGVWSARRRTAARSGAATPVPRVAPLAGSAPVLLTGRSDGAPPSGPLHRPGTVLRAPGPSQPVSPPSLAFIGTRQLSFRLLPLLLEVSEDRDAPADSPRATQAGLAHRLGVGQSGVSKVLHQLVLGGVVEVSSAHVAGISRRVRVYRLTPKGDRLARALRAAPSEPVP
ncbi:MAG TPA: PKD domain-containing protein [Thermoplasmata archaeon]